MNRANVEALAAAIAAYTEASGGLAAFLASRGVLVPSALDYKDAVRLSELETILLLPHTLERIARGDPA